MLRLCKNLLHFTNALMASLYYRFPGKKMTVIGITGTSGKTTVTHLVYEIFKRAGKKTSMISSIEAIINGKKYDTGFHVSTPSPWQLQKFMHQAVLGNCEYFVLEVTSHALDQHRALGASIDIGVITNISHEHLDYHKNLSNYQKTKAKILRKVQYAVLNKDDSCFELVKKLASGKLITYSVEKPADYQYKKVKIKTNLKGKFSQYNCLAAYGVAKIFKIDESIIRESLSGFEGIPGRMEEIITEKSFRIIIDFAHKPNALEEVLTTARKETKNKLIVVFGCAGLRDRLKRPMMGEIAGRLADYVILTAEDPRTEDVRKIIEEITKGCLKQSLIEKESRGKKIINLDPHQKYFWRISDRQEAINFVMRRLAKRGDLVILCGKGHEKSMCYGKTEYPWDEKKAVEKAIYDTV